MKKTAVLIPCYNKSKTIAKEASGYLSGNVSDIMTGYRAFSRTFVKSFPVLSKGFEIETEMTIHALDKNLYIKSIPVDYRDRPTGSVSKLNTFSDGMKVLKTIGHLFKDYKPLAFFSIVSALFMLIALVLCIPVLIEYVKTGLVPRFPTLIVAGFMAVFAIQSLTCGFILDTQGKLNRQNFALQMNILKQSEQFADEEQQKV